MTYLIDTDIIIYSLKKVPAVIENMNRHKNDDLFVSAITIGELVYGAEKSQRRERNLQNVSIVEETFGVIEISRGIMKVFGKIKAEQEKKGLVVADMDLQIAATAMCMDMALVTNNTKHFSKINNLRLENWNNE